MGTQATERIIRVGYFDELGIQVYSPGPYMLFRMVDEGAGGKVIGAIHALSRKREVSALYVPNFHYCISAGDLLVRSRDQGIASVAIRVSKYLNGVDLDLLWQKTLREYGIKVKVRDMDPKDPNSYPAVWNYATELAFAS